MAGTVLSIYLILMTPPLHGQRLFRLLILAPLPGAGLVCAVVQMLLMALHFIFRSALVWPISCMVTLCLSQG